MAARLNKDAKNGPAPGEGGRPPKVTDLDVARRAASLGCTSDEIATLLGIGRRTFFDHLVDTDLKDAIDEGRNEGRTTLRRLQWQRAHAGSDTMLIWLGKQLLGQKDRTEIGGDPARPVRYVIRGPSPVDSTAEWLKLHAPPHAAGQPEIDIEIDGEAELPSPTEQ